VEHWADREAETILDAFLAYEGPDDLVLLQQGIVAALFRAYESGRDGETPDTSMPRA
jgi:hypothetical protein